MRPKGLPSEAVIRSLPTQPLRILVSGCLGQLPCGVEGTSYGSYPKVEQIIALPGVQRVLFCPEDYSFGTPRQTCNIIGGDGFAVLRGERRVMTHEGNDWTDGLIRAAEQMLAVAREAKVDLAILMDISAACGSSVIYDGNRSNKVYQRGAGVCAARLIAAGIPIISQRDAYSLEILHNHLDPSYAIDESARDFYRSDWYIEYFS